jgi:polyisoprenoid-binding protein YceI
MAGASKWCLDPASVQVVWTAFKTTQKVGVNGNFTTLKVVAPNKGAKGLSQLLNSLKAEIKLEGAASLSTGNPGRDQTLFDHFFKYLKGPIQIKGRIHHAEGTDEKGELMLDLSMNGKKKGVPMTWIRTPEGGFTATGTLDVLDFGLKTAFDDLHKTCEVLHTGSDGISKTWSEVALQIQAKLIPGCGK